MSVLRLRKEGLTWLETDGELVALDAQASAYLSGNATATLLWPALAEGTSREELYERLISAFDVDRAIAERDVDAFVADLEARNLLEEPE